MGQLTKEQRYTIFVMKIRGYKQIDISKAIGKDKSVVSRELKRNCDKRNGEYRYDLAHRNYLSRLIGKAKRQRFTTNVKDQVEFLIREDFSPEQIEGRLRAEGKSYVSHERIYQHIWSDLKAGGSLYTHLRRNKKRYRKRGGAKDTRGQLKNRIGIERRPVIVDEKSRFGDLEIDTVMGKNHKGALLTINDRLTGMVWIRLLQGKEAAPLAKATVEALNPIKDLLHTITADNGKEFARHEQIAKELDLNIYFARPYHSWERGANENTNGLIRQYFKKGSSFDGITQERVQWVQDKLNNRPRKRLNYLTPNEEYNYVVNNVNVAFAT
jgi:IS30 family transposase